MVLNLARRFAVLLAFFLAVAYGAAQTTTSGPISSQQINYDFFVGGPLPSNLIHVGGTDYTSGLATACAANGGFGRVIIPQGSNPSDAPTIGGQPTYTITGGCTNVTIRDMRGLVGDVCYSYTNSTTYTSYTCTVGGSLTGAVLLAPSGNQTVTQPSATNFNVVTSGGGKVEYNGSEVCSAGNYTTLCPSSGGSLPTASAPGQIISSTASGTTYAVQPQVFYNQTGDTISSIETECSSACTYVVTVPQTLTLGSSHSLNSNVNLLFLAGGKWTVNGSFTLTIPTQVQGTPTQHFAGTSTIAGVPGTILPEWFGAVENQGCGGTSSDTAIHAALGAISANGGTLFFGPYAYLYSTTLTPIAGVKIVGSGADVNGTTGTTLWLNSATADGIDIASVIGVSVKYVNQQRCVKPTTTTAAGIRVTGSPATILDTINIGDSNPSLFTYNDPSYTVGTFSHINMQFGNVSGYTSGDALKCVDDDSTGGQGMDTAFFVNDSCSVANSATSAPIIMFHMHGPLLDDQDVDAFNCGEGVAVGSYCMKIESTSVGGNNASDISIRSLIATSCRTCLYIDGIDVGATHSINGIIISDAILVGSVPVVIQNSGNVTLTNSRNISSNNGNPAITLTTDTGILIANNQITNSGYAVSLSGTTNSSITGNNCLGESGNNFTTCWLFATSTGNVLANNVADYANHMESFDSGSADKNQEWSNSYGANVTNAMDPSSNQVWVNESKDIYRFDGGAAYDTGLMTSSSTTGTCPLFANTSSGGGNWCLATLGSAKLVAAAQLLDGFRGAGNMTFQTASNLALATMPSDGFLGFGNTIGTSTYPAAPSTYAPDTCFSRDSAGTLDVGNCTTGDKSGSLKLANIMLTGTCTGCGSGTGTVTTFSAGTLSPLFTTSVATATTTPALTFALTNAAQNSIFAGPPTGGAGAPSYQTAPTFSAANLTSIPPCTTCMTGTTPTNHGVLLGAGTQAVGVTAAGTASTVLIGQSGADPIFSNNPTLSGLSLTATSSASVLSIINSTAATNVANQGSALAVWDSNYWTGSASAVDGWTLGTVLGSGTNPTTTLTFTHSTGSSGAASVAVPAFALNGSQVMTGIQGSTGVKFAAATGAFTNGNCRQTDANGNEADSGAACGAGGTPAYPQTVTGCVSGGILYGSLTTQVTCSPAGTAGQVVLWGGAGTAPGSQTIGTSGSVLCLVSATCSFSATVNFTTLRSMTITDGSNAASLPMTTLSTFTANGAVFAYSGTISPTSLSSTQAGMISSAASIGAASTTYTGMLTGTALRDSLGAATSTVYNGSQPLSELYLAPTINVATTSTAGYAVLNINPTETSISTAPNYLIWAGAGGTQKFTLSNGGTGLFAGTVTSALGNAAITSATGGTGVTSVTCATASCNVSRGSYTIVGGTATTGTIATLVWPTTTTAWVCSVDMNGGTGFLGIGHGVATATGMTITAGITVIGITFTVDYNCVP